MKIVLDKCISIYIRTIRKINFQVNKHLLAVTQREQNNIWEGNIHDPSIKSSSAFKARCNMMMFPISFATAS